MNNHPEDTDRAERIRRAGITAQALIDADRTGFDQWETELRSDQ